MGAQVVMVCRDRARGEEAQREIRRSSGNEQIDLFLADFSSLQEVRQVVQEIQSHYSQIDVLINNAGRIFPERRQVSRDGIEMTFAANQNWRIRMLDWRRGIGKKGSQKPERSNLHPKALAIVIAKALGKRADDLRHLDKNSERAALERARQCERDDDRRLIERR